MAHQIRMDGDGARASVGELLGQTEWVRALARAVARDTSTADDLAQDALTAALAGRAPSGEGLRPWLAGTVRNLARFYDRRDAHRRGREREMARPESAEDHARTLAEAEAHRFLVDHVLALDERDRDVLLARYFRGRSRAEIARSAGNSVAAVSSQLTRAHGKLRTRLEAKGGRDQWLAGLAPLLTHTGAGGIKLQPAATVFASAWTLGAAGLAVVTMALILLIRNPGPSTPPFDVAPVASEDDIDWDSSAVDVALAGAVDRTPAIELPAVNQDVLVATVVAAEGTPIPRGRLWIEDGMGRAIANAALGPGGRAEFRALPSGAPLNAYLSVDGTRWPEPIAAFESPPGGEAKLTWTVFLTTRVELRAVDLATGSTTVQILGITRSGTARREFATDIRAKSVVQVAMGDDDGHAVFEGIPPGRYGAGVIEYSLRREEVQPDGTLRIYIGDSPRNPGCPTTVPIEVPPNVEHMTVEVHVHRGQRIAGRVVDAGGNGLFDVELRSSTKGIGGSLKATSNEDGSFSFGHVVPGTYSIQSQHSNGGWVLSDFVEVESDTEDVLLELVRAGEVRLTVTGADTEDVWIWRARVGAGSMSPGGGGPHDLVGGRLDVTLRGLQPGTHWISAHDAEGTRLGVAWPVHVASKPKSTTCLIDLARALEVEVVNRDATRAVSARPDFGEFLTTGGYAAAGESDVVAVLPGTSTILLRLSGGEWIPHVVSGAAGERVTIEVGTPAPTAPGDPR